MKKIFFSFVAILLCTSSYAQIAINNDGSAPDESAALDIAYTNKGFLPPRLTLEQIAAIPDPAEGLMVYCTTNEKVYIFIGIIYAWKEVDFGTGTVDPPFSCGHGLTRIHTVGNVAPVDKTVTYGTVTDIPGESAKCWLT